MDRWTYYALEFLEKVHQGSKFTLKEMVGVSRCASTIIQSNLFSFPMQFRSLPLKEVRSTPYYRTDLFRRNIDEVR